MSKKFYLGLDYAKRFSVATLIDDSGRVVKRAKLSNERVSFESFLKGYSSIHAVTEAGRNWRVAVELLEGLVNDMKLAHPLKVKAIAEAKIKTDTIDFGNASPAAARRVDSGSILEKQRVGQPSKDCAFQEFLRTHANKSS